jgi:hypothetical protein
MRPPGIKKHEPKECENTHTSIAKKPLAEYYCTKCDVYLCYSCKEAHDLLLNNDDERHKGGWIKIEQKKEIQ